MPVSTFKALPKEYSNFIMANGIPNAIATISEAIPD